MTFKPTEEQSAIIHAATITTDNLLVSALAGAAKTSTLVLLAEALPDLKILALCFNKKIAVEMQERMPRNCTCQTLNSLGHRIWQDAIGRRLRIESSKVYDITSAYMETLSPEEKKILYPRMADLMNTVRFGKACGFIPEGTPRMKALMREQEFFAHLDEKLTEEEELLVVHVTSESIKQAWQGICDYDDQILMPTLGIGAFPRYPLILIDEAQDLSALNHAMLKKLVTKRIIAVGDACQPAGTLVTVVDKLGDRWNPPKLRKVPIEQLSVGDKLLGYNGEGAFIFNRTVEGISSNLFEGNLTTVKMAAGESSKYTENHHCYASFEPFRKYYALYVMRKGDKFRLGRCKMDYECGSGPTRRAHAEGADAYWILGVYKTEREAALEEAVAQAHFGIPDITFICPNQNIGFANQDYLDEAWSYILASVNLTERAEQCFDYYNRMMEYPIWQKGFPAKFSLLRPSIMQACNLISGCLMLPYNGDSKSAKAAWEPVEVLHEWVEDLEVYSLTVSDNHLYVADNIVTHNCQAIYGFRGAHEESMDLLKSTFSMVELPLSISFRCPISVVEAARWRAPTMQYPEWAIQGEVRRYSGWTTEDIPDGSAIICRNNAPLFRMAITLLKAGRYPELSGNDIGKALLKVMKKFGNSSMSRNEVFQNISDWKEAQLKKARKSGIRAVEDKAECMTIFAEVGATLGESIAYAEHLFSSSGPVKCMTGHKSKGLEYDYVFFLDQHLLDIEGQDRNLRYVIITRAKKFLGFIRTEDYGKVN